MEKTENKNGVWIVENPTVERMDAVKEDFEKIQLEGKTYYSPHYADNRVIIKNIDDEEFVLINNYFDIFNHGYTKTKGEDYEKENN